MWQLIIVTVGLYHLGLADQVAWLVDRFCSSGSKWSDYDFDADHIEGVLSPGKGLSGIFCDGSTLWNDPTVFLSGDRKGKDCISVCNFDWDGSADADRTGPF